MALQLNYKKKTNNCLITELYKNKHIDMYQKNKLHCSAGSAPILYGLPKIHKTGTPLRPIVFSKYIGNVLQRLVSKEYNIDN